MTEQFQRQTAYKLRVGDLLKGKPMLEAAQEGATENQNPRFNFLDLGDKQIIRANIVANVVEKYISEGEKKFISFTIDDASGQIRVKAFGEDVEKFKGIEQGHTVMIIGLLRYFNNEVYIQPEIIRVQDPRYLLVRKLELEKEMPKLINKEEVKAIKDQIIEMIKKEEANGGVETEKLILELKASPDLINQEVRKLLEDGLAYEPRPGKIRYLG